MPDNSFDVVSLIEMPEVNNAIQQAMKEITTRYDLKDSKSTIELNEKEKKITLASSDDFKLKAVSEILNQKLVKRGVPIRNLTYGTITSAAGSSVKCSCLALRRISTLETSKSRISRRSGLVSERKTMASSNRFGRPWKQTFVPGGFASSSLPTKSLASCAGSSNS